MINSVWLIWIIIQKNKKIYLWIITYQFTYELLTFTLLLFKLK